MIHFAELVRATGAIRIIIANNETPANKDPSANKINPAIQTFREVASLDTISSLGFGARSFDDDSRLNATLILGNVIDNKSVCVPLDHLYDDELGTTPYGVRGRANFLGVVSVVAPWAYKENYENIRRLHEDIAERLQPLKDRPDLKQTFEILANIKRRLDFQLTTPGSNMNTQLPLDLQACKTYVVQYGRGKLIYD